MKKILIPVFSLFCFFMVSADEQTPVEDDNVIADFDHYIGGTAGFSTGYGLTYRYWPEDLGAQIVFTPYWTQDDESGDRININVGVTGFKTLYETKYTRLFLYLAGSYYYNYNEYYSYSFNEETGEEIKGDKQVSSDFDIVGGFGPGFEVYLFKNIAIDAMFGYRYSYQDGLSFTGECGIYYRF